MGPFDTTTEDRLSGEASKLTERLEQLSEQMEQEVNKFCDFVSEGTNYRKIREEVLRETIFNKPVVEFFPYSHKGDTEHCGFKGQILLEEEALDIELFPQWCTFNFKSKKQMEESIKHIEQFIRRTAVIRGKPNQGE